MKSTGNDPADTKRSHRTSSTSGENRPSLTAKPRYSSNLRHGINPSDGAAQSPEPPAAGSPANSPSESTPRRTKSSIKDRMRLEDLSKHARKSPGLPQGGHRQPTSQPDQNAIRSPTSALGTGLLRTPSTKDPLAAGTASPSLEQAFAPPSQSDAPTSTSTASTESSKTIRGDEMETPEPSQVHTPSYPFPFVPSNTKGQSSPLNPKFSESRASARDRFYSDSHRCHQKSSSSATEPRHEYPSCRRGSGVDLSNLSEEQANFPSPNIYDMVLELNARPDLEVWWRVLTENLRKWFKAQRAILSVPADPTDIENVPWAQKASYDVNGLRDRLIIKDSLSQDSTATENATTRQNASGGSKKGALVPPRQSNRFSRPPIESRHSYAGFESRKETERLSQTAKNQKTPMAPISDTLPWDQDFQSQQNVENNFSMGSTDVEAVLATDPNALVFPTLRVLEGEREMLLDATSVNRVLERNKPVTLTRQYPSPGADSRHHSRNGSDLSRSSDDRSVREGYFSEIGRRQALPFEEHEQIPASPWSQSPAPSPAVQSDPEENPFFVGQGNIEEDSFSPSAAEEDYSRFGEVQAIGVDSASTVVHLPLVHPSISRGKGSPSMSSYPSFSVDNPKTRPSPTDDDTENKAPIAILSFHSSTVPYPQNLCESLRHLSPHLATSFHVGMQFADLRWSSRRHRYDGLQRALAGHGDAYGLGLSSLMRVDPDDNSSSITESTASPSEPSNHKSPGGSLASTPTGDMASPTVGRNISPREGGSASEMVDAPNDSFDAIARQGHIRRFLNRDLRSHEPPESEDVLDDKDDTTSRSTSDHRPFSAKRMHSTTDGRRSTSFKASSTRPRAPSSTPSFHTTNSKPAPSQEQTPKPDSSAQIEVQNRGKKHSLLHSYGADFTASFQSLPAITGVHDERDEFDMPPPSDSLLRIIIDALPCQVFTASPTTGNLTWVNSKYFVYRGHATRDVLERPWATIHREDYSSYINSWRTSLANGHQFQQKVRLLRFDNAYRWFFVRAVPLRDKNQNIVHWIGTYVDYHDQHLAEMNASRQQETAASEAKYRALANSSPQIVFSATRERGINFCNNQWISYSGQSAEEAMGLGFIDHVHPEDINKCKLPKLDEGEGGTNSVPISLPTVPKRTQSHTSSMGEHSDDTNDTNVTLTGFSVSSPTELPQRKLSELAGKGILRIAKDNTGKPSYSTEVRLKTRSGEYRWHLIRVLLADPLIQDENQQETWYGSCSDINDHKELESQLKETMDAKSRFLSNMSHEIRTPLNGIHGMTSFLVESKLSDDQMEHVNIIRASTDGLLGLINDILDLSKVEAGMITLNMDWLHIRSVVEEVNDMMATLALDKGLELNCLVEDSVPAVVKGDKFRIRQVLLNTVGNAIKFTRTGEVFVRCQVTKGKGGSDNKNAKEDCIYLEFLVQDTGPGFTEGEADRLFKRFSQIDGSSTRHHGGSGLGLVISMQLVELHGGTMSATSTPGKGSTFAFSLKLEMPAPEINSANDPTNGQMENAAHLKMMQNEAKSAEQLSPRTTADPLMSVGLSSSPQAYIASGKNSPSADSIGGSTSSSVSAATAIRSSSSASRGSSGSSGDPIKAHPAVKIVDRSLAPNTLLYIVLVICSSPWAREATVKHLESTFPEGIPSQVRAVADTDEAKKVMSGPTPPHFTHFVINMKDAQEISRFVHDISQHQTHHSAKLVVVSDTAQKKELFFIQPDNKLQDLVKTGHVWILFKPLKSTKLAPIFDPKRSRELSLDSVQSNPQQLAVEQKQVFDETTKQLGNKSFKVLIVEDNPVNQKVLSRFLKRIDVAAEIAMDGVQCVEKVFKQPAGHYSIILCDLHMPNKDGYQTCREIREWERNNEHEPIPIVALSANVLGDVYEACANVGFNSFLTKPVDFKDLGDVMYKFLEPEGGVAPVEFLRQDRRS
ncbi:MAG: hypothetical protein M1831_006223 [Alyxoria varia]|nr:MAG: hypothetical protein M1831_006223 [Alyxoria varia]